MKRIDRLKIKFGRYLIRIKTVGLIKASIKGFDTLVTKPLKGLYNYHKYKNKYKQNIIFIAGFAKSGSTWIANMLSELPGFDKYVLTGWQKRIAKTWDDYITTDLYPNCFDEFKNRLALIKGHTRGKPENVKILEENYLKTIISVRDPRDKIISSYYYILNNPDHWDFKNAKNRSLDEYITYKLDSGEYEKEVIEWLRSWEETYNPNTMKIVKYEDALIDTKLFLNSVVEFLGYSISRNKIERIASKYEFKNLTGRKRGNEDNKEFIRKGISGEWESIFSQQQKEKFFKIGEDMVQWLGYKPTLSLKSN